MLPITVDQARSLRHGVTLHHMMLKNADGTPLRARVNGKVKLWKREPERFEIPLKHGLRDCGYMREDDVSFWSLSVEEA